MPALDTWRAAQSRPSYQPRCDGLPALPRCRGPRSRASAPGNARAPDPRRTSRLGPPTPAREEGARGGGCNSGPAGLAWSWAGGRRRRPGLGGGEAPRVLGSLADGEGGKVTVGPPVAGSFLNLGWRSVWCPAHAVASLKPVVKKVRVIKHFIP